MNIASSSHIDYARYKGWTIRNSQHPKRGYFTIKTQLEKEARIITIIYVYREPKEWAETLSKTYAAIDREEAYADEQRSGRYFQNLQPV